MTLLVTKETLKEYGLEREALEQILLHPKMGFNREPLLLNQRGAFGENYGIKIRDISPSSCFFNKVAAHDVITAFNGNRLIFNSGHFLVEIDGAARKITELYPDGTDVTIQFTSVIFSKKPVNPQAGGSAIPPELVNKEAKLTIHYLYEITDPDIIRSIEAKKVLSMPASIKAEIFNQDKAVDKIHKSLKVYFAGLKEASKPIGGYLMVGPTGTGKTELAKLLAKRLEFNFVRVDMSEYSLEHSVSRLIGAPPSYVGYGEKTILEKEIGSGKRTVLLLDEMEKAHFDLQKIFLQALDNSRITLSNGNEVDFSNTLILMTSNLGIVTESSIGIGAENNDRLRVDHELVRRAFLPEFIGRLSGIVEFNPLGVEHAKEILNKFVVEFNENRLADKGTKINLTEAATSFIISKGFNPKYGARPLKNALQHEVFEKVADLLLTKKKVPAQITIDCVNGEIEAVDAAEDKI